MKVLKVKKDIIDYLKKWGDRNYSSKAFVMAADKKGVVTKILGMRATGGACMPSISTDELTQETLNVYRMGLNPVGLARVSIYSDQVGYDGAYYRHDYRGNLHNQGFLLSWVVPTKSLYAHYQDPTTLKVEKVEIEIEV